MLDQIATAYLHAEAPTSTATKPIGCQIFLPDLEGKPAVLKKPYVCLVELNAKTDKCKSAIWHHQEAERGQRIYSHATAERPTFEVGKSNGWKRKKNTIKATCYDHEFLKSFSKDWSFKAVYSGALIEYPSTSPNTDTLELAVPEQKTQGLWPLPLPDIPRTGDDNSVRQRSRPVSPERIEYRPSQDHKYQESSPKECRHNRFEKNAQRPASAISGVHATRPQSAVLSRSLSQSGRPATASPSRQFSASSKRQESGDISVKMKGSQSAPAIRTTRKISMTPSWERSVPLPKDYLFNRHHRSIKPKPHGSKPGSIGRSDSSSNLKDSTSSMTSTVGQNASFSSEETTSKSPRPKPRQLLLTSPNGASFRRQSFIKKKTLPEEKDDSPKDKHSPKDATQLLLRRLSIALGADEFRKAVDAFVKFSTMSEISCDDLVVVLREVGFRHPLPTMTEVESIIADKFVGKSFLDKDDYFRMISIYYEQYWANLQQQFREADTDHSGKLCREEVAGVLEKKNITPVRRLVKELMREVVGAVADDEDDGSWNVGLDEFVKLLDIIEYRKGFSLAETARIKDAFEKYSTDSESVEFTQLCTILQTLGLSMDWRKVKDIVAKVRPNKNIAKSFDRDEVFRIVRKSHEYKLKLISSAMADVGQDQRKTIKTESLPQLFQTLGLMARPQVLEEVKNACDAFPNKELVLDDVYTIVETFRETQGFLSSEREEIQQAFRKFENDLTHPDGVSGLELAQAVNWLGYPATERSVKDAILTLHIGDHFEDADFLKVLGKFRKEQVASISMLFNMQGLAHGLANDDDNNKIRIGKLRDVLTSLGYNTSCEIWRPFVAELGGERTKMSMWNIDRVASEFRRDTRDRLQKREGFSDIEAESLENLFSAQDKRGVGSLCHAPLRAILAQHMPEIGKGGIQSQQEYLAAQAILQESDFDGNEQIDFQEFLHMMRLIADHTQAKLLSGGRLGFKKERAAISFSRFSIEEVFEFRNVFEENSTESCGGLHPSNFEDMIARLLLAKRKGTPSEHLTPQHFKDVVKKLMHAVSTDLNHTLDFPEFLYVMREILDTVPGYSEIARGSSDNEHGDEVWEDGSVRSSIRSFRSLYEFEAIRREASFIPKLSQEDLESLSRRDSLLDGQSQEILDAKKKSHELEQGSDDDELAAKRVREELVGIDRNRAGQEATLKLVGLDANDEQDRFPREHSQKELVALGQHEKSADLVGLEIEHAEEGLDLVDANDEQDHLSIKSSQEELVTIRQEENVAALDTYNAEQGHTWLDANDEEDYFPRKNSQKALVAPVEQEEAVDVIGLEMDYAEQGQDLLDANDEQYYRPIKHSQEELVTTREEKHVAELDTYNTKQGHSWLDANDEDDYFPRKNSQKELVAAEQEKTVARPHAERGHDLVDANDKQHHLSIKSSQKELVTIRQEENVAELDTYNAEQGHTWLDANDEDDYFPRKNSQKELVVADQEETVARPHTEQGYDLVDANDEQDYLPIKNSQELVATREQEESVDSISLETDHAEQDQEWVDANDAQDYLPMKNSQEELVATQEQEEAGDWIGLERDHAEQDHPWVGVSDEGLDTASAEQGLSSKIAREANQSRIWGKSEHRKESRHSLVEVEHGREPEADDSEDEEVDVLKADFVDDVVAKVAEESRNSLVEVVHRSASDADSSSESEDSEGEKADVLNIDNVKDNAERGFALKPPHDEANQSHVLGKGERHKESRHSLVEVVHRSDSKSDAGFENIDLVDDEVDVLKTDFGVLDQENAEPDLALRTPHEAIQSHALGKGEPLQESRHSLVEVTHRSASNADTSSESEDREAEEADVLKTDFVGHDDIDSSSDFGVDFIT